MFTRLQKWLRGEPPPAAFAPSRDLIVPRIRNVSYVEPLSRVERERDVVPVEPLVGELVVAYAFDRPELFQMVSLRDLAVLDLGKDELRKTAVTNALRILDGQFPSKMQGPFLEINGAGPLTTTALLVPAFWDAMRDALGAELVVGVPRTDVLVACPLDDTQAVGMLATMILMDDGDAPLSPDLLLWTDRWELLEQPDD